MYRFGDGVEQDAALGLRLVTRAAELGYPPAGVEAAARLLTGEASAADVQRGVYFVRTAAAAGIGSGAYMLGVLHLAGRHVERDLGSAVQWLTRASELEVPFATLRLAELYEKGLGVDADAARAAELRERVLPGLSIGARNGFAWSSPCAPTPTSRGDPLSSSRSRPYPAGISIRSPPRMPRRGGSPKRRARSNEPSTRWPTTRPRRRSTTSQRASSFFGPVNLPRGTVTRLLATLYGCVSLAAAAQPIGHSALRLLAGRASLERRRGLEQSFERVLSLYDGEIAAQPHRIRAQISRCDFVESFPAQYEGAAFSDEIYERAEQCEQDLVARFPDHPELRLWQLVRTYGDDERLAAGQELLSLVDVHGWTRGQRARLYTELANVSERLDRTAVPRAHCRVRAARVDHDIRADVRLILGAYFQETGDAAAAVDALTSPFDGHDPEDNWYRVRKMAYLADLEARDAVRALHAELDDSSYYDRTEAAAALRAVGELELAQQELADDAGSFYGTADDRQRFLLALEAGSADEAQAAYDSWRDAGFWEDPIGINRFALFVAHPGLPWHGRDALGLVGALVFLAAIVLVWCVPLGLVHYRGLVNRVRGTMPLPHDGLQLRDAWLGLAALSLASFIALYTIGPFDAFSDETQPWAIIAEQSQLADLLVVESLLNIALLAAVAYVLRRHLAAWWAVDWSIGKCIVVAAPPRWSFVCRCS